MFHKVKYSSLNELIYEEIKQKIIYNELKPNERLDVDYLSSSLGVSRTPVTNALKSLSKDGYVIINPRSGSYVRELSKEELRSIFNFREALESQVIREIISSEELIKSGVLENFEYEFKQMLNVRFGNNVDEKRHMVQNYFDTEMKFHEYLIDLCPKIIGDEIKNLIDLTKRIRILHIAYKLNQLEIESFHEEICIHCDLIDALLEHKMENAIEKIVLDIRNTKEDILECFDKIN